MTKYVKTPEDIAREEADLASSPIMRFLKSRDQYVFNIGDILIKETKYAGDKWVPTKTAIGAIKKYMYVFENELGIGYIRQLKVDGSGLTTNISCVANYDPTTVRLSLDPDYADHLILGGGEKFNWNEAYLRKKEYRQEAMKKNKALLIKTRNAENLMKWFHSVKKGDRVWASWVFDKLHAEEYEIVDMMENNAFPCPNHNLFNPGSLAAQFATYPSRCTRQLAIRSVSDGKLFQVDSSWFSNRYVTMSKPYPLEENL